MEAADQAHCDRSAAVAYALVVVVCLWRRLPLLEEPGALLHEDGLCDDWWIVHGDSLRGPDHGVEAALALEAPDGGWFCAGGDNTRTPDHRACFCGFHGR